jgi:acyl carrier protein
MQANVSVSTQTSPTADVIQGWIIDFVAKVLEIEPAQVDTKAAFDQYGLDSATAISLICYLEDQLGHELNPTLLYDLPSIEALAQRLAAEL